MAASRLSRSISDSQVERETGTTARQSVAVPQSSSAVTLALLLTLLLKALRITLRPAAALVHVLSALIKCHMLYFCLIALQM